MDSFIREEIAKENTENLKRLTNIASGMLFYIDKVMV